VRCGGSTSVASPECTPAFSTCSDTAETITSPSEATASNSSSRAFSRNFDTTTGCFGETRVARLRKLSSSVSFDATPIAAPDSTYEGRTSTG
jgi:hypothetical protein